ncbi:alpha-amylase [Vibrio sp. CAIM 722]|uniref:Alpha-amylase n=1 Tax=Vibrio eleionomae TaxID=2653505 RepID=A0A7X4RUY8_9VIBR|nr:alpha-amylase family glycosyl hydrolase [Vibrio eleionomae]MZI93998.1 alpha-amylase [Vibrio eleionomae]
MTCQPTDVILHTFDWPYALISERAEAIYRAGYRSVLISPPMKSFKQEMGTPWWQRYQPQDYRVIDNQLGNTESLTQMVAILDHYDIHVYADIVFNHMANESSLRLDLQYPSASDLADYKQNEAYFERQKLFGDLSEPLFTEQDFVEAFGIKDWKDKWEVQNGRITGGPKDKGLPTLRDNDHVINQQRQFLQALKRIGIKGFRIDAAKHLSLEHIRRVWSDDIVHDMHIFGEIITDGGATRQEYQLFLQPYLEQTRLGAYDFPLFQTVYNAFACQGSLTTLVDPYSFGEALSKERAVTFAITHDVPNNDAFRGQVMDEVAESLAYSYLLGQDGGVPLIYSDLDTSGIKNREGKPRWKNVWQDKAMAARIEFHNRMHGLSMNPILATDNVLIFTRGDQGAVSINKSSHSFTINLNFPVDLIDILTGERFVSDRGQVTINTPGRASRMLLCDR